MTKPIKTPQEILVKCKAHNILITQALTDIEEYYKSKFIEKLREIEKTEWAKVKRLNPNSETYIHQYRQAQRVSEIITYFNLE